MRAAACDRVEKIIFLRWLVESNVIFSTTKKMLKMHKHIGHNNIFMTVFLNNPAPHEQKSLCFFFCDLPATGVFNKPTATAEPRQPLGPTSHGGVHAASHRLSGGFRQNLTHRDFVATVLTFGNHDTKTLRGPSTTDRVILVKFYRCEFCREAKRHA